MYIPHLNTKQNLLKQVSKMEEYMIVQNILSNKNIAQDSTFAKLPQAMIFARTKLK
jgi:hypothetical protein